MLMCCGNGNGCKTQGQFDPPFARPAAPRRERGLVVVTRRARSWAVALSRMRRGIAAARLPGPGRRTSHFCRIHGANYGCAIHRGKAMHYAATIGLSAPILDQQRGSAHAELGTRRGAPHPVGGEEPLPPVPQRGRFPAPRCRPSWRGRAGGRAPAGARQRRPRLGARHGRALVRGPRRQAARVLRSRRRARDSISRRATTASASARRPVAGE